MNTLNERYSAEDVLQHVDDPQSFIEEFTDAVERRRQAKQAFVEALNPEVKAEWIDGRAVFHSPARRAHNWTRHAIETLIGIHCAGDVRIEVSSEKAMMQALDNLYEPDVAVWTNLDEPFDDEMITYPPCDLVVEVLSKKTASTDRGSKFVNYAKAGIAEYWIVDAKKQIVEQYVNEGSAYVIKVILRLEDVIASEVIDELRISVAALFSPPHFVDAVVSTAKLRGERLSDHTPTSFF